jgi:hypothetical protein
MLKQNPRRISPAGARLTIGCAYFAQQLSLTRQHPPPPQQSAEREVAFAVPTKARAATIINRYFIRFLLLNFLSPRPAVAGRADAIKPPRVAAAEQADDASGPAREWKAWQRIPHRSADKQTVSPWIRKAPDQRRTRRNIVCPARTWARADRNCLPAWPLSPSRSSPLSRSAESRIGRARWRAVSKRRSRS